MWNNKNVILVLSLLVINRSSHAAAGFVANGRRFGTRRLASITASGSGSGSSSTSEQTQSSTAEEMERVVNRYFEGVNERDYAKIRSCFADEATIRDVCGIHDSKQRQVTARDLTERCRDFLTAHPDATVKFHYGPEKGRSSNWVVAHWYETGTWSGTSRGIEPTNDPIKVEGQTRFWIDSDHNKIRELVVTRTFTEWETALLQKQTREAAEKTSSSTDKEEEPSSSISTNGMDLGAWKELNKDDLKQMLQVSQEAARAAGKVILSHVGCCSEVAEECELKTSLKDIVTEYDKTAQTAIEDIVRSKFPHHSFLGEEDVDPGAAASEEALSRALEASESGFVWICDPIDGTANFASGLPLCAVTMGVVYKGVPVVGVVYDPHKDEMFTAIKGEGAFLNHHDKRLIVAQATDTVGDAIINAGCPADPNAFEASVRGMLALNGCSRGLRVVACSALTTAWIAAGRLTAHFGYDLSSWDLVAGALLVQEAGGVVTDLDGTDYNLGTRNMLCSNGYVHEEVLNVLREADAVSFERAS